MSQPSCVRGLLQLEGLTSCNHSRPAQTLGAASWARELQDPSARAKVCVTVRAVHPSWGSPQLQTSCSQSGLCIFSSYDKDHLGCRVCDSLSVCLSPSAKFPQEQLFTLKSSHPETRPEMLRQIFMEHESSYSSSVISNLLFCFFEF